MVSERLSRWSFREIRSFLREFLTEVTIELAAMATMMTATAARRILKSLELKKEDLGF